MLSPGTLAWGAFVFVEACRAAPQSGAGTQLDVGAAASEITTSPTGSGRRLQGRFLHITDVHPDPFYKTYSSTEAESACHRKRGPAGVYGAETSGCDSPLSLVNETFKWIQDNLRDQIDFIIWTGDSARHDNDERIPRTQAQVIEQNELIVSKFAQVFGSGNDDHADPTNDLVLPIVPTFGNNDIMPHNIFLSGPNKWTIKYLDIWRAFIPEAQRHSFQQGGWFSVEVIPNQLVVISLNTLYFFDSNSGVDGCADKHEPGYEHMEWLRIQLSIIRERGMKAMLIGHVPPARVDSKESWDETCWQKLTLWERQFRDVIVGSFYGHMNIDHFMLHDFDDLKKSTKKGRMSASAGSNHVRSLHTDGEVTTESASDYLIDLGDAWAKLPKPPKSSKQRIHESTEEYSDASEEEGPNSLWDWISTVFKKPRKSKKGGRGGKDKKGKNDKKRFLDSIGGKYASRFSVAHVAPSVVPNYFPTLRVFSYNISGLENTIVASKQSPPNTRISPRPGQQTPRFNEDSSACDASWATEVESVVEFKKSKKEKDARKKKKKKYKFKVPKGPTKSTPPGPAYSPQTLSLLSYVQYYANLTRINNDFVVQTDYIDEYVSAPTQYQAIVDEDDDDDNMEEEKWKEGKHKGHQGKKPRPKPHPKKFKFEVEYNTTNHDLFKLKDLTVRSYVDLARRIGQAKEGTKSSSAEQKENIWCAELEEDNDDWEEEDLDEDDVLGLQKKGKKKKGKHGKKKHGKKGKAWYTFVKRAFVSTMDPHEIEESFGVYHTDDAQLEENTEL